MLSEIRSVQTGHHNTNGAIVTGRLVLLRADVAHVHTYTLHATLQKVVVDFFYALQHSNIYKASVSLPRLVCTDANKLSTNLSCAT